MSLLEVVQIMNRKVNAEERVKYVEEHLIHVEIVCCRRLLIACLLI